MNIIPKGQSRTQEKPKVINKVKIPPSLSFSQKLSKETKDSILLYLDFEYQPNCVTFFIKII